MPTVREKSNGRLVVVFRNRGRFVTKQLTPRGEQIVRGICPTPNGAQIGYQLLNDLSQSGDAYTNRGKRQEIRQSPSAPRAQERPGEIALPTWLSKGQTFPCSNCGAATTPGAAFCPRCGGALSPKGGRDQSAWTKVCIVLGIVVVAWFCFHTR